MHGKKKFMFVGKLESVQFNLTTTAVMMPHHLGTELPKGRLRVIGLMNGAPFSLPIQFRKNAGRFFSVSAELRQSARINVGDTVNVFFRLMDLEKVEIPEIFEMTASREEKLNRGWRKSLGKSDKILVEYLGSVKKIDSRMRKAIEKVQKAKSAPLPIQVTRKKKNG